MPKKPEPAAEPSKSEARKTLYTVLIDGADHAVYAADAEDLQKQITKLREQKKS